MSSKSKICDQLVTLFASAPIQKTTGMTLRYDSEARAILRCGAINILIATGSGSFVVTSKSI